MPRLRFTRRFIRALNQLPDDIQQKAHRQLRFLAENPRHPSLQSKPIHGIEGIFEARVDQSYRMTYQRLPGDILVLRVIGKHDETIHNP
jgi:mRNA-degrading endonuclease RelE of RelBE toxin-antitoxin system